MDASYPKERRISFEINLICASYDIFFAPEKSKGIIFQFLHRLTSLLKEKGNTPVTDFLFLLFSFMINNTIKETKIISPKLL